MDRITHQSPRQRGYGSTSSLRNDSLKHTRKHERRKGGIEPRSKAHSLWRTVRPDRAERPRWAARTVRQGTADYPHPCRGLSGLSRGPSVKTNRTTRGTPRATNRPRGACGLSARHPRTVRPLLWTVRNSVQPKLKNATDQNERRARTQRTRDEQERRRPSARMARTVGEARIEQKNARPRKSTPPNHHRISQTVEAVETRVWDLKSVTQGCYSPKILPPNPLNHRESRILLSTTKSLSTERKLSNRSGFPAFEGTRSTTKMRETSIHVSLKEIQGETHSNPRNRTENKGMKTSTKRPRKTQL
jgi:hypothetical protein